jgi:hypothetical protein
VARAKNILRKRDAALKDSQARTDRAESAVLTLKADKDSLSAELDVVLGA